MIAKTEIQNNLTQINNLYKNSTGKKKPLFYSKLAILELCGWIEESIDDIVRRCTNQHLKNVEDRNYVTTQIIQRTYSFTYDMHFRKMLVPIVGLVNVERLERKLDSAKFDRMKSTIGVLKTTRDEEAHTHLNYGKRLDAPSLTLRYLEWVYDGLKDIDNCIRKMKI
jgi:hypothetical protein